MRLADLIHGLPVTLAPPDAGSVEICDVTEDSRTVTPGALFIARPGGTHDGATFISDAIRAGAAAVLTTTPAQNIPTNASGSVGVLGGPDARGVCRIGAVIAERFHGSPSSRLKVVGVTGTNGKSTIAHMVHRMLNSAGVRCGLVGTVELDDGRTLAKASMTTPPATAMSGLLAGMRDARCAAAAIEVSSHAMDQGRCDGVRLECAVFTNLTGDHLDYHRTMDEYARCKAMLFEQLGPDALAVVNADDPAHARMIERCRSTTVRTSIRRTDTDAHARVLGLSDRGTHAIYHGPWGSIEATCPFIGAHNVSNALQAMVCADRLGLTSEQMRAGLSRLSTPAGRLECVSEASDGIMVLVDYAHSDDSLAHALASVRPVAEQRRGRVLVVFGCGGNRDTTKRPRMGRVAGDGADLVFITSDNPRTERPEAIIADICAGMSDAMRARTRVEPDRRRAIEDAIDAAGPGDVVLIAGKGHEDYQILPAPSGSPDRTIRIDFDDRVVARRALDQRRAAHAPLIEAKSSDEFWTARGLARAAGGTLVGEGTSRITSVCTDTRAIVPGCVFVALVGERFDAHAFVPDAVEKGAACVVVHRDVDPLSVPVIRVSDTGAALMDMGAAWRRALTGTRVIGVTGSNGKTTTCRMIDAVLSLRLRGGASIKSFNNAIGVPLTVLGAKPGDDYLVAEAGMNAPGEMAPLSRILAPDIAVITSIGRAHVGAFADGARGIAREKAALAAHLSPGGKIFASADSPELRAEMGDDCRVVWVGRADDADVRVDIPASPHAGGVSGDETTFRIGPETFTVSAPGAHNALNAALAVVVARDLGLSDDDIRAGLRSFTPAPMRLERVRIGAISVINDAYNANPESMIASLEWLATAPSEGRRVAVLGQMLEMGRRSEELHAEVGAFLRGLRRPPELVVTVGPGARAMGAASGLPHLHADTLDTQAGQRIASILRQGDLVLLKGSRGVGLERLIPAIESAGRCSTTSI